MVTVFWDMHGIIHIVSLKKGQKIIAQYYAELLDRFDATIKAEGQDLAREKVLFRQDNALTKKAVKTMAKLTELKYMVGHLTFGI